MAASTIADLPQLSMLTIFDHLPLMDLFHIDEVCSAWARLKTTALLRRRQLVIDNDPSGLKLLEAGPHRPAESLIYLVKDEKGDTPYARPRGSLDRHALVIKGFGLGRLLPEMVDRLTELLPNVVVLRVITRGAHSSEMWKVKQLLTHYRHQLVEVTVWFWESFSAMHGERSKEDVEQASETMFISLMATLNQLTAVRRLEVNYQAPPTCTLLVPPESVRLAAVVSGLKSLSFRTFFNFADFGENKERTLDARLLERILLEAFEGGVVRGDSTPPELYCAATPLYLLPLIFFGDVSLISAGLRSVEIDDVFDHATAEVRMLTEFAQQTPNLEQLTIRLKGLRTLRKVVETLTFAPNSLSSLVHLKITFAISKAEVARGGCSGEEYEKKRKEEEEKEEEEAKKKPLPVLPSVKSLTLTIPTADHRDYEQLHLEVLFPNAQVLLLNHLGWGCHQCNYQIPRQVLRPPNYRSLNVAQFKAAYGGQLQKCLLRVRTETLLKMPNLAALQVNIRPLKISLPFKNQLFTTRQSMSLLKEFVDEQSGEEDYDENGKNEQVVTY